jgi:hypothetical protein
MTTRMRGPMGEVNKLIVAFKMHFFNCLSADDQRRQLDVLIEACDKELARLADLRSYEPLTATSGYLPSWLELEIDEIAARRTWFEGLKAKIAP